MEHDLIRDILREKIEVVQKRIDGYRNHIENLEDSVTLSRDFYDNGNTKVYFVCQSSNEKMAVKEDEWCEENLGYTPICLFVEGGGGRSSGEVLRRMVVLFRDEEDLSAYKLMFS